MDRKRLAPTERTRVRRLPHRGVYDRATIHEILDEALVCHLGFVWEGSPYVLPTSYARRGDEIIVHGSSASRMFAVLAAGGPVCCTVTLLDGLVLARSGFHHSMNYRSVVVMGSMRELTEAALKFAALNAIVEHVIPGRAAEVRAPSELELKATRVLTLPITEASAKVRSGPPIDDEEDYERAVWAGVVPLELLAGTLLPCPRLKPELPVPHYLQGYSRVAHSAQNGPEITHPA